MSEDEIKAAEARGYQKGYAAGRKCKGKKATAEQRRRHRDHLWNRAFIAALPACLASKGWTQGERTFSKLPDKVELARMAADEALTWLRY